MTPATPFSGFVGADLTTKARFAEYHDGYIMTDGFFMDKSSTNYTAVYGSGAIASCFMLLAGDVSACSNTFVLCEKTLNGDSEICLDKTAASTKVVMNTSAELLVTSVSKLILLGQSTVNLFPIFSI